MHFLTGKYLRSMKTRQNLSISGKKRMIFSFFRVFSYSRAKLTSCLFQISCWIRGQCQLSALFNLGQQDTKPKWQTLLRQTLLSSSIYPTCRGLFHQSHIFCYQQQHYHGSNESPVLVVHQWWAKLQCLSQYCRDDLWVPLISVAFMELTEWDEIAFYCAKSLL